MLKTSHIICIILFLSTEVFTQIESHIFLEGASITGISGNEDNLWVSTYGQGIFNYTSKNDKWNNYSTKRENLENDLFYNLAVSKNFVWAGSGDGLFTLDRKKNVWRKRKFAQGGEMGNWIRALCYDSIKNILWIGRFKNVTMLEVGKQKFTDLDLTQNNDPKTNNITSIELDSDSLVWFGSESGVHIYNRKGDIQDKKNWTFINSNNGFNTEGDAVSVRDILFEEGNAWFATDEFITKEQPEFNLGGIFNYNRRSKWNRISKKHGLSSNGIYCLERTGNYIWAGLYAFDRAAKKEYGKGLAFIDRLTYKVEMIDLNEIEINTSTILALHFDDMNLWVGSDKGLIKINFYEPLAQWSAKKVVQKKEPLKTKKKKN